MGNYNQQQMQPDQYGEQRYQGQQSQQQYYNQSRQSIYYDESPEEVMTVKDWVKTLWLQTIPWVNIVLLLIWAFSSDTKKAKSNYAKGFLIYWLSLCGVVIVAMILIMLLAIFIVAAAS